MLTVPSANVSASAGQSLQLSSLFSATDADNDALTYYFVDSTTNGGHFEVNGAVKAAGVVFSLTAAQLAQTVFVAGPRGSSDHLNVQISDGKAVSAVGDFHVNVAPNHAPVLTVPSANVSASAGQSLQLSSLFSATDADNDALTYYFVDSTTNGGHFEVNGAVKAAGVVFSLTAAQLAQTVFVAGPRGSSDHLNMQVSDGQAVSAVGDFHVNVVKSRAGADGAVSECVGKRRPVAAALQPVQRDRCRQ